MTENQKVKPYLIAYDRPTKRHTWRHTPLMEWGDLLDALRVRGDWVRQTAESFGPREWRAWEYRIVVCTLAYPPETLPKTWNGGTLE